jgi:hypothetical protein
METSSPEGNKYEEIQPKESAQFSGTACDVHDIDTIKIVVKLHQMDVDEWRS